MTKKFERFNKYLVLKQEDIEKYNSQAPVFLDILLRDIALGRLKDGKKQNSYVVVNENEPYSEIVWKLIEISQLRPEHMKDLINNILLEFDMEEHLGSAYI